MRRITGLSLISIAIISLAFLLMVGTAVEIEAQDASLQISDLSAKVSVIVQDIQAAVSEWNGNYYAGSTEELAPARNPGLAATGQYSSLFPAASLQITEMPYSLGPY